MERIKIYNNNGRVVFSTITLRNVNFFSYDFMTQALKYSCFAYSGISFVKPKLNLVSSVPQATLERSLQTSFIVQILALMKM